VPDWWRYDPFVVIMSERTKVIYLVPYFTHADVERRVDMLRKGGADVTVIGFYRDTADHTLASKVIPLGETHDGNFPQRIAAVVKALMHLGRHAKEIGSGHVIMARGLEMLLLGAVARRRFLPGRPLIYECLDIHRFMTQRNLLGRLLRRIEGGLLSRTHGLVTSSAGFLREYFHRAYTHLPRTLVVENKVFPGVAYDRPDKADLQPGPPWRIGWFGVIRCRRSLEILSDVARRAPGLIEVVIAGRPTTAVFNDAEAAFSGIPGIRYIGPYADEEELARLFASVHFAWVMDFLEAGANSDWLLPNRLYRAVYYSAVPICFADVETGHWLAERSAGLRLDRPDADELIAKLRSMTPALFRAVQERLDHIPTSDLVTGAEECQSLVRFLQEPSARQLLDQGDPVATQRSKRHAEVSN
jgi:succinoglycan biosynthesis protein ExoL